MDTLIARQPTLAEWTCLRQLVFKMDSNLNQSEHLLQSLDISIHTTHIMMCRENEAKGNRKAQHARGKRKDALVAKKD